MTGPTQEEEFASIREGWKKQADRMNLSEEKWVQLNGRLVPILKIQKLTWEYLNNCRYWYETWKLSSSPDREISIRRWSKLLDKAEDRWIEIYNLRHFGEAQQLPFKVKEEITAYESIPLFFFEERDYLSFVEIPSFFFEETDDSLAGDDSIESVEEEADSYFIIPPFIFDGDSNTDLGSQSNEVMNYKDHDNKLLGKNRFTIVLDFNRKLFDRGKGEKISEFSYEKSFRLVISDCGYQPDSWSTNYLVKFCGNYAKFFFERKLFVKLPDRVKKKLSGDTSFHFHFVHNYFFFDQDKEYKLTTNWLYLVTNGPISLYSYYGCLELFDTFIEEGGRKLIYSQGYWSKSLSSALFGYISFSRGEFGLQLTMGKNHFFFLFIPKMFDRGKEMELSIWGSCFLKLDYEFKYLLTLWYTYSMVWVFVDTGDGCHWVVRKSQGESVSWTSENGGNFFSLDIWDGGMLLWDVRFAPLHKVVFESAAELEYTGLWSVGNVGWMGIGFITVECFDTNWQHETYLQCVPEIYKQLAAVLKCQRFGNLISSARISGQGLFFAASFLCEAMLLAASLTSLAKSVRVNVPWLDWFTNFTTILSSGEELFQLQIQCGCTQLHPELILHLILLQLGHGLFHNEAVFIHELLLLGDGAHELEHINFWRGVEFFLAPVHFLGKVSQILWLEVLLNKYEYRLISISSVATTVRAQVCLLAYKQTWIWGSASTHDDQLECFLVDIPEVFEQLHINFCPAREMKIILMGIQNANVLTLMISLEWKCAANCSAQLACIPVQARSLNVTAPGVIPHLMLLFYGAKSVGFRFILPIVIAGYIKWLFLVMESKRAIKNMHNLLAGKLLYKLLGYRSYNKFSFVHTSTTNEEESLIILGDELLKFLLMAYLKWEFRLLYTKLWDAENVSLINVILISAVSFSTIKCYGANPMRGKSCYASVRSLTNQGRARKVYPISAIFFLYSLCYGRHVFVSYIQWLSLGYQTTRGHVKLRLYERMVETQSLLTEILHTVVGRCDVLLKWDFPFFSGCYWSLCCCSFTELQGKDPDKWTDQIPATCYIPVRMVSLQALKHLRYCTQLLRRTQLRVVQVLLVQERLVGYLRWKYRLLSQGLWNVVADGGYSRLTRVADGGYSRLKRKGFLLYYAQPTSVLYGGNILQVHSSEVIGSSDKAIQEETIITKNRHFFAQDGKELVAGPCSEVTLLGLLRVSTVANFTGLVIYTGGSSQPVGTGRCPDFFMLLNVQHALTLILEDKDVVKGKGMSCTSPKSRVPLLIVLSVSSSVSKVESDVATCGIVGRWILGWWSVSYISSRVVRETL